MSGWPEGSWFARHPWFVVIGGALWVVGILLLTQFRNVESSVTRMIELTSGVSRSTPPAPVAEPAAKKVEPPKPTVACLRESAEMIAQLKALGGDKWGPSFDRHFKNRTTCMVLALTELADGRLTFLYQDEGRWNYLVTPRSRADLKRFKPGTRLLIEGDLDRYVDTGPGVPDEIHILRARLTEAKDQDELATGSIRN